ncbi:MAG: PQQ-binding-like beta-propeller repeat protein [Boseongicola sp.]|nr:PQQ-binding-like beta-propeller repeat protein [Boseongicola sp.]
MVSRSFKTGLGVAFALAILVGCSEEELILPGERFDVRDRGEGAAVAVVEQGPGVAEGPPPSVELPPARLNASWTHAGGNAAHTIAHPVLDRELQSVWSASIGEGNSRGHRITADPVVADGRVFTKDSRALISAFSLSGERLWTRDLTPASDQSNDASGGGLAVSEGVLFATSGFGTLTAMDAATGAVRWTQALNAAATGAPTVSGDRVFVATRNGIGWAIDTSNGRILWEVLGRRGPAGLVGGPGPSIAGPLVIFPFASGQVIAAGINTGAPTWGASVAGRDATRAFSVISDLTGAPVVDSTRLYAGSHAGRVAAVSLASGEVEWTAQVGALNPIWLGGNSVFFVSPESVLTRLDAATGQQYWSVELPFFEESRANRLKSTFVHYGPVLAGGRLIVASDDGLLREFDPVSGALLSETELGRGAARNPVVAGGVLYLVTEDGQIRAFR